MSFQGLESIFMCCGWPKSYVNLCFLLENLTVDIVFFLEWLSDSLKKIIIKKIIVAIYKILLLLRFKSDTFLLLF